MHNLLFIFSPRLARLLTQKVEYEALLTINGDDIKHKGISAIPATKTSDRLRHFFIVIKGIGIKSMAKIETAARRKVC